MDMKIEKVIRRRIGRSSSAGHVQVAFAANVPGAEGGSTRPAEAPETREEDHMASERTEARPEPADVAPEELEAEEGEVLPERAAMSIVQIDPLGDFATLPVEPRNPV
jgi:hypothetical protein